MGDAIGVTITTSRDWQWDKDHNVQLSPATLARFDADVREGDYVRVSNPATDLESVTFGRVDVREDLDADTAGIGMNLRYALGAAVGERVEIEPFERELKPLSHVLLGSTLRVRPVICRARKAVHPDIGFNVCRLTEETMGLLGVEPGDRVVLETTEGYTSVKALPMTDAIEDKKARQRAQNPGRYPDCLDRLAVRRLAGTDVDLPAVFIDASERETLGLDERPESGVCQPVWVYRDPVSYFLRSVNEVSVPVVLGLLGVLFLFDQYLSALQSAVIVAVAVLVILASLAYTGQADID